MGMKESISFKMKFAVKTLTDSNLNSRDLFFLRHQVNNSVLLSAYGILGHFSPTGKGPGVMVLQINVSDLYLNSS